LKRKEPETARDEDGGAKKKARTEGQFHCMSPQNFSPVVSPNKENEDNQPSPRKGRAKHCEDETSDVEPAVVTRVGKTPIARRLRARAPTKVK
jgi:hypothetical protein